MKHHIDQELGILAGSKQSPPLPPTKKGFLKSCYLSAYFEVHKSKSKVGSLGRFFREL